MKLVNEKLIAGVDENFHTSYSWRRLTVSVVIQRGQQVVEGRCTVWCYFTKHTREIRMGRKKKHQNSFFGIKVDRLELGFLVI